MRKAVTDPVYRHRLLQLTADAVLVAAAYWLAFALRFDQGIPDRYSDLLWQTIAFVTVGKVAIFAAFGLYQKWWRYVGLRDFESILKAVVTASLVMVGVLYVWSPTDSDLPRSIAVMDLLLTIALIGGVAPRRAERARAPAARRGAAQGPGGPDRRRRRGRPADRAGDAAHARGCARPRSASWTTIRASAACASTA